MSKHNLTTIIVLAAIFGLALYLRNLGLPNNLLFGYEQGRDALVAKNIITGAKYTLLGPKTDIDGIYHGVLYYYFLAIVYYLSQLNPALAIIVFTIVNTFVVLVTYLLTQTFTQNRLSSLFSALLAALSFNQVLYGRWLSNVSPSILISALFFLFFVKLAKSQKTIYWIPTMFFYGLLFHFEILHGLYGLFVLAAGTRLFKIPIKSKHLIFGLLSLIFLISPFLLFDLRHEFLQTKGVLAYLTGSAISVRPLEVLKGYSEGLIEEFVTAIFPTNGVLISVLVVYLIYLYQKQSYTKNKTEAQNSQLLLLLTFWSFPYIFLVKHGFLMQFYAGTSVILVAAFTYLLTKTYAHFNKVILLFLGLYLVYGNLRYMQTNLPRRDHIFYHSTQKELTYQSQLEVIDYMFKNTSEPFSFEAFTIPYYHPQAWEYLYDWYGQATYPEKYHLNQSTPVKKILYLIIEPGTESIWKDKWLKEHNQTTKVLSKNKFGEIKLQTREYLAD